MAAVGGGSAVGQLILVFASPLITRLYGPEAFGTWGLFNAVALLIAPVAALTYTTAIVLPEREADALALVRLSVWLTISSCVLTIILFLFLGNALGAMIGLKEDAAVLSLIGVYVLTIGIGAIAQQWLIRLNHFRRLAVSNVAYSGFTAVAQVLGGFLSPTALMLVGSNSIGRGLHSALLVSFAGFRRSSTKYSGEWVSAYCVARKYKQFPVFRAPQVLVDGVSQALPVVLLAGLFGPAAAGFYALCRSVLGMPGQVVGNAVADVFYARVVDSYHSGQKITRLVGRATVLLLVSLSVPVMVVIIFGPSLFGLVFGTDWAVAGNYAQWLSVWIWLMVSNRAALQAIHVLGLQRFHLILTVIGSAVRFGVLVGAAALDFSALQAVAVFSLASAFINIFLIVLVLRFCRRRDMQLMSGAG